MSQKSIAEIQDENKWRALHDELGDAIARLNGIWERMRPPVTPKRRGTLGDLTDNEMDDHEDDPKYRIPSHPQSVNAELVEKIIGALMDEYDVGHVNQYVEGFKSADRVDVVRSVLATLAARAALAGGEQR